MTDSFIQVAPDSTGKKMQTAEQTVSGQDVHAEVVMESLSDGSISSLNPSNSSSSTYEASRIIKASAGKLFCLTGFNSKTAGQFILIFDSATLPSEGTPPTLAPIRVPSSSNFSISFGGKFGRYFSSGIVVCNSSTPDTKTIGVADCWFDAQYK